MSLRAISPIDGRYAEKLDALRPYLSEWALMKYRLDVEARWLRALSEHEGISHVRAFTAAEGQALRGMVDGFDDADAAAIKSIEASIRHDVKAVEIFMKSKLRATSLADVLESIHFACTSADINNLAYALMIRDAMRAVWQPAASQLLQNLESRSRAYAGAAMLARTHGQAASPTSMGKELRVFVLRLRRQLRQIEAQEYLGKFNGAVGAFNAHAAAYPELDWQSLSRQFVCSLGLAYNPVTTQIEPHDWLAELCQGIMRFNTALLDCCRDIWAYIALGYFRQRALAAEVGSSTMPHKVNPIHFENAEANLGVSSALLAHLAGKLPVSRWQRDLSDTSALRNLGVGIAHSLLALRSTDAGLARIELDQAALKADLDEAWEVLAEAVQTVLRKHHVPDAYEQLKALTRGAAIDREALHDFIRALDIPAGDKAHLLDLQPATYLGLAEALALDDLSESKASPPPPVATDL